jgi:hypothetical protein
MHPDEEILTGADLGRMKAWKARFNAANTVPIDPSQASTTSFLARMAEADKAVSAWEGFLGHESCHIGEFDADMRAARVMKVRKLPDGYIAAAGRVVALCEFKEVRPGNYGVAEEYYMGYKGVRDETGEPLFVLFHCDGTKEMWACDINDYGSTRERKMPDGRTRRYVYFKRQMSPETFVKTLKDSYL